MARQVPQALAACTALACLLVVLAPTTTAAAAASSCIWSGSSCACIADPATIRIAQDSSGDAALLSLDAGVGPDTENTPTVPWQLERGQLTRSALATHPTAGRLHITQVLQPSVDGAFRWETTFVGEGGANSSAGADGVADALAVRLCASSASNGEHDQPAVWAPYAAFPPLVAGGYLAAIPATLASAATGGLDFVLGTEHTVPMAAETGERSSLRQTTAPRQVQWAAPMMTILPTAARPLAVSMVAALNQTIISARARVVYSAGQACQPSTFLYYRRRLLAGDPVTITHHLLPHAPLWRPPMAWLRGAFPEYILPHSPAVVAPLWGAAQYHDYRGNSYDFTRWRELGLAFNWDATFPFAWWGAFTSAASNWSLCVPVGHANTPVPWTAQWPQNAHPESSYGCDPLSADKVAGWYQQSLDNMGTATLYYANPFEFGFDVREPAAPLPASCSQTPRPLGPRSAADASCECNQAFRSGMAEGVLRDPSGAMINATCCGIGHGMVLIDPSTPAFQEWVLGVLELQILHTPGAGACLDRSDHAAAFRRGGDDGLAWWSAVGGVTSALVSGWKQLAARMAALLHAHNQAMVISTTRNVRLDLYRHVDATYDEFGDERSVMMALGLLNTDRPLAMWNHNDQGNLSSSFQAWPGLVQRLSTLSHARTLALISIYQTPKQDAMGRRGICFFRCTCWWGLRRLCRRRGATTPMCPTRRRTGISATMRRCGSCCAARAGSWRRRRWPLPAARCGQTPSQQSMAR